MHSFPLRPVAAAILALLSTAVAAQQTPLAPVVVTATRSAQSPYDIPAAIDVATVPADGSLDVNLSERVQAIPGIVVRDRQNYAQDAQVSIRGFGARSTGTVHLPRARIPSRRSAVGDFHNRMSGTPGPERNSS